MIWINFFWTQIFLKTWTPNRPFWKYKVSVFISLKHWLKIVSLIVSLLFTYFIGPFHTFLVRTFFKAKIQRLYFNLNWRYQKKNPRNPQKSQKYFWIGSLSFQLLMVPIMTEYTSFKKILLLKSELYSAR